MNYVKLVNFELKRFMKLFAVLAVLISVIQLAVAALSAYHHKTNAEETMRIDGLSLDEYLTMYGNALYSMMTYVNDGGFQMSVVIGGVVMVIYVFFIWYRDWLGKSAFMYRLLMLPSARIYIFLAKLTTIAIFTALLISLQKGLLIVSETIISSIVPAELFYKENDIILYSYNLITLLFPQSVLEFAFLYGGGIAVVAVLFTAILCERSFGLLGIVYGIVYGIICFGLLVIPFYVDSATNKLFPNELCLFVIGMSAIVLSLSIIVSNYLLKRKITV